jgi:biopolymer transport protein ExbB
MLAAGVEHLREPRDLIEEVMYEEVLTTRLRLQNMLPFIAICAAAAPLLGLLGTVTGMINTFKLITVFGTGDVKTLSGGISEALITTKFGLIVAVPSLLLPPFFPAKPAARSIRWKRPRSHLPTRSAKRAMSASTILQRTMGC